MKYEVNVLSEGEVDLEIVYEDGKLGAEILAVVHDDHGDDEKTMEMMTTEMMTTEMMTTEMMPRR